MASQSNRFGLFGEFDELSMEENLFKLCELYETLLGQAVELLPDDKKEEYKAAHKLLDDQRKLYKRRASATATTAKPKNYRLVEITPDPGQRYPQKNRREIYKGPDKAAMKKAIADWCALDPRPAYGDLVYYYGNKRIYAYEL